LLPERVSSHPVLLRPFTPADAPHVQALVADPEVAEPTSSIPHPYPPGAAAAWIASHGADRELGREYAYAIASSVGTTLVGAIVLRPLADADSDTIGYWIGRPYWGHGYATAATMAITALAFGYLDCEALTAAHLERNAASGRVLEKSALGCFAPSSATIAGAARPSACAASAATPGNCISADRRARVCLRKTRAETARNGRREARGRGAQARRDRRPARGASRRRSRAA
jgi:RimJ/RimL family protein N-acetyltransferase